MKGHSHSVFSENLLEVSPLSNKAKASWLHDRHGVKSGWREGVLRFGFYFLIILL